MQTLFLSSWGLIVRGSVLGLLVSIGAQAEEVAQAEGSSGTTATSGELEASSPAASPSEQSEEAPAALRKYLAGQSPACPVLAAAKREEGWAVACGEEGLWYVRSVAGIYFVAAREKLEKPVIGLREVDGQLEAVLGEIAPPPSQEEEPAVVAQPEEKPATKERPVWPALRPWGQVTRVDSGQVFVELTPEAREQLKHSRPFRLAFVQPGESSEEVVGTVIRISSDQKQIVVSIGMNEDVAVGSQALLSESLATGSLAVPHETKALYAVGADVRPWLGWGGGGSGILTEAFVSARLGQVRLSAAAAPVVIPLGSTAFAAEAFLSAGVVFRYAEFSLGMGTASANRDYPHAPGMGILITPSLRLGTEDGFHVKVRTGATIFHQRSIFSSFRVDSQIPVSYGTFLLVGGGGGPTGYGYGHVGLRQLMSGNGGRGSWFWQGVFGIAGSHELSLYDEVAQKESYGRSSTGPLLGLGFEYRF